MVQNIVQKIVQRSKGPMVQSNFTLYTQNLVQKMVQEVSGPKNSPKVQGSMVQSIFYPMPFEGGESHE